MDKNRLWELMHSQDQTCNPRHIMAMSYEYTPALDIPWDFVGYVF